MSLGMTVLEELHKQRQARLAELHKQRLARYERQDAPPPLVVIVRQEPRVGCLGYFLWGVALWFIVPWLLGAYAVFTHR